MEVSRGVIVNADCVLCLDELATYLLEIGFVLPPAFVPRTSHRLGALADYEIYVQIVGRNQYIYTSGCTVLIKQIRNNSNT